MRLSKKLLLSLVIVFVVGFLWAFFIITPLLNFISQKIIHIDPTVKPMIVYPLAFIPTTGFFWLLMHHFILKPVNQLTVVTKDIASGFLGRKLDIQSKDEMGELSKNINTIYTNLSRALQNMANSLRDERKKESALADNIQKLSAEKAKVDAMLSSIADGVFALDNNKNVLFSNFSASALSGYGMSEVIGKEYNLFLKFYPFKSQTPSDDVNYSNQVIDQVLTGKQPKTSFRGFMLTKTETKLPVEVSVAPIKNFLGETLGAVVVFRDITSEMQLNKMKDEFVSVASHELRTPMTAIKGMISMIFEGDYGPINSDLKEPLTDIYTSVNRLINLVNDLLDVSRIEAGRTKYTLTDVSVAGIAKEIAKLFKPLSDQKGLKLELIVEDYNIVKTDADKIKEIVSNLLSNSLKFTDKGSITITVKSKGDFVYISVTDTGLGISFPDQKKLFNKFEQVENNQNGRPQGTGLGLYISKEYAKKLGGDLWIENSQVGTGSTFTLSLPIVNSEISKRVVDEITKNIPNQTFAKT